MAENYIIEFYYLNVRIDSFDEDKVRDLVLKTIKQEEKKAGTLQFIFCDDDYLLEMNRTFLNHDTLTDIITFDYCQEMEGISGDIFISLPRVRENAEKYSSGFLEELHRVILHGVLHLLGYGDATEKEKRVMRSKENYYLTLLF